MRYQVFSVKRILIAFFAVLIATAPMMADDNSSNKGFTSFGLSIASPMGDLGRISSRGFSLSLSREWPLERKRAIKATIEFAKFADRTFLVDSDNPGYPGIEQNGSANIVVGTLSYIHPFVSIDKGLYWFTGAGIGVTSAKPNPDWNGYRRGGFGVCMTIGIGYNIAKNFGIEASFIGTSSYNTGSGLRSHSWNQVSLKYRF